MDCPRCDLAICVCVPSPYAKRPPVFDDNPLPTPTDHLPGSPEKYVVLMLRADRGEQLFHPDDAKIKGKDEVPLFSNGAHHKGETATMGTRETVQQSDVETDPDDHE